MMTKYNFTINWFPGHMTKARREMQACMKMIDVVVELLDARVPYSSSNPMLAEIIENRPRLIALNKIDLADKVATRSWVAYFAGQGITTCEIESVSGRGVKELLALTVKEGLKRQSNLIARGVKPRAVKAMIAGIPNVGKSSLINRIAGQAIVKAADRPGVTRGKQLIKTNKNLELLDTPGILWPRLEEQTSALYLAFTGAIRDEVVDIDQITVLLAEYLLASFSDRLMARYGEEVIQVNDGKECLQKIAQRRGLLRTGAVADIEQAGKLLINEFRAGKLGCFTLDDIKMMANKSL